MKIRNVKKNNRRKAFEVTTHRKVYLFPYVKLDVPPSRADVIREVFVDKELGNEGFTYVLESGQEGTVHIDNVLEYNQDPGYLKDMLLYKLTLAAQEQVENMVVDYADSASYQYGQIYTQWGDIDNALTWLETAWQIRDPGLLNAGTDALLDPLRDEPRFKIILESAGL